ncbi:acylneuraminate cytidylyltransferase family protein [Roseibium sp. HPY-6]|uniref:acylneuraminate cytidylyltransferase family protein n=1 Tax=Roseibium sp. HPY-6 TaxID=3229852 RepID=UPI00338DC474
MSVVVYVPARSGSKRVQNKNFLPLAGRPLVYWTLDSVFATPSIDTVIFSSDSQEYLDRVAQDYSDPKLKLHLRTAEQAGDKVKLFDYLAAEAHNLFAPEDTVLVCLPTAPFRDAQDVEAALALHRRTGLGVFSTCAFDFPVAFGLYLGDGEDGDWTPTVPDSPLLSGDTRSQDQREAHHPNGAVYIRRGSDFQDASVTSFFVDAVPYPMPRIRSVDIDTKTDFAIAELIAGTNLHRR